MEDPTEDAAKTPPPRVPPDRTRMRTRGHIEDFGQGRVCATNGCEIVLSRYNSGNKCWMHDDESRARRP